MGCASSARASAFPVRSGLIGTLASRFLLPIAGRQTYRPLHRREGSMRHRFVGSLVLMLTLWPTSRVICQEDDTHSMLFWLSEDYLHDLAEKRTIRYPMELTMDARSGVHQLSSDCEMHVASETPTQGYSSPPAVVVEPPNACKQRVLGMK